MARGPANSPNRKSPAKKKPAKAKRPASTAPAKGTRKRTGARKAATATTKRAGKKAVRKASKKMGKPKTASTASHRGSSKPAARSPKTSRRRAAASQSKNDQQAAASGGDDAPGAIGGRVVVRNVNVPGYKSSLDAAKYGAVRDALLAALPAQAPGLTHVEMARAVQPRLPPELAERAMWWTKAVQLDLEAKGELAREAAKPLRWHRLR